MPSPHKERAIRVRLVRTYEIPEMHGGSTSKTKESLFHDKQEQNEVPSAMETLIGRKCNGI
nr:protein FAR1-RELATED SEQUENCE 5-like [Ipomoea batatas]